MHIHPLPSSRHFSFICSLTPLGLACALSSTFTLTVPTAKLYLTSVSSYQSDAGITACLVCAQEEEDSKRKQGEGEGTDVDVSVRIANDGRGRAMQDHTGNQMSGLFLVEEALRRVMELVEDV